MNQLKPTVSAQDHWKGRENASVVLVEYGDYQCPYCGRAYPIIQSIMDVMSNDLKFVFRNFPIAELHPQAVSAAVAAEAANLQHQFWEMHDIIFEQQHRLQAADLFAHAKKIGLNLEKFGQDIQLDSLLEKIDLDLESGIRSGVNGTPSFFINGKKWEGNWEDRDEFLEYLQVQLEK